jgi:peptidoglycan hydrolase CwlO-like protein
MADDLFDFGFTLVDENELEVVQQAQSQVASVSSNVEETQAKLDKLYNAIQPLLNNLKMNPEKEYILWPNRTEKIEQFEDHIQSIYQGTK